MLQPHVNAPLAPWGYSRQDALGREPRMSKRRKKMVPPMKTAKIRIYPTTAQRRVLWQWFKAARDSWNAGLNDINEYSTLNTREYLQFACKSREGIALRNDPKLPTIPHAPDTVRDLALADLKSAFDNGFKALREGRVRHFNINFRSCRAKQSIAFDARLFNASTNMFSPRLWAAALGSDEPKWLRSAEPLPAVTEQCSITYESGQYHIHIPVPLEDIVPTTENTVAAVDLGSRTFATAYNGSQYMEWGKGGDAHLSNISQHMDHLLATAHWVKTHSALPGPRRRRTLYRMRRAIKKMRLQLRNKVTALHARCATDLCRQHRTIILGNLETSRLVLRERRRIGKRTVRSLLTWRYHEFKQRLLHKARETNTNVIVADEAYTSVTRGCCGQLGARSASKTLYCQHCNVHVDRDFNGARNILLRWLTAGCPPTLATTAPPAETGDQEMTDNY